jgi:hypothetical protein
MDAGNSLNRTRIILRRSGAKWVGTTISRILADRKGKRFGVALVRNPQILHPLLDSESKGLSTPNEHPGR